MKSNSLSLFYITFYKKKYLFSKQSAGFIATFPSTVLAGTNAKFCIRLLNIESNVRIMVKDDLPYSFDAFVKVISKDGIAFLFKLS